MGHEALVYDCFVRERSDDEPTPPSRRGRFRRFRRAVFGEPAAVAFYGPADLGPGRYASREEWDQYYDELRNPPPRRPSEPPPGYRFIWYTDTTGQQHRAAVKDTPGAQAPRSSSRSEPVTDTSEKPDPSASR